MYWHNFSLMSLQFFFLYKKLQRSIRQQSGYYTEPKTFEAQESERAQTKYTHSRDETTPNSQRYQHDGIQVERVEPGNNLEADDEEYIIVKFDGDHDENNPKNWSFTRKLYATILATCAGIVGGWVSANGSTIIPQARETFGVSEITESLSTGLYLISFGLGSLISGPFSETLGRFRYILSRSCC